MASSPPGGDSAAVARAVAELIRALGLDPKTEPELVQTPERVAELYREIFAGLDPANAPDLAVFPHPPERDGHELVVVRNIEFHSLCVHHFVPFFGRAHIAYLPGDKLVGISGPARLVEYHARRPQLQERMARGIADDLERALEPRGVAVTLVARHLCMEMRGVRRRANVHTQVRRGVLADPAWAPSLL